jgi:hypothetical protein
MSPSSPGNWLSDPRGNPSRWVALLFAIMFGIGAVTVAVLGQGYPVTAVLAFLFLACFDAAFGRRPVAVQVAAVLARRGRGASPGGA